MDITILADASHCPVTNAAGYGFWIASERGKKGGSGAFKTVLPSSTIAEMMAIVNALYCAIRFELVHKHDNVLIQTDCEAAIFALTNRRKLNNLEFECVSRMRLLLTEHSLTVTYKHVKAHTTRTQSRYKSNNACDRAAKNAMRKMRASLTVANLNQIIDKAKIHHETVS